MILSTHQWLNDIYPLMSTPRTLRPLRLVKIAVGNDGVDVCNVILDAGNSNVDVRTRQEGLLQQRLRYGKRIVRRTLHLLPRPSTK